MTSSSSPPAVEAVAVGDRACAPPAATTTTTTTTADGAATTTTTPTSPAPTTTSSSKISLHDGLALGGFWEGGSASREDGVVAGDRYYNASSSSASSAAAAAVVVVDASEQREEIRRLPLLMRILSEARPLSSVPVLIPVVSPTLPSPPGKDKDGEEQQDDEDDPVIRQAVDRLEDRAARYSAAEGIELVACQLAPAVCRKASRLKPLSRAAPPRPRAAGAGGGGTSSSSWTTDELEAVASSPLKGRRSTTRQLSSGSSIKRKFSGGPMKTKKGVEPSGGPDDSKEDEQGERYDDSDGDLSDVDQEELAVAGAVDGSPPQQKQRMLRRQSSRGRRESLAWASEDSQEATVIRALSELASLVVRSLKTSSQIEAEAGTGSTPSSRFALKIEDSILAEEKPPRSSNISVDRVFSMSGCDLASTVSSIMYHAPVLRHDHVAVRTSTYPFTKFDFLQCCSYFFLCVPPFSWIRLHCVALPYRKLPI